MAFVLLAGLSFEDREEPGVAAVLKGIGAYAVRAGDPDTPVLADSEATPDKVIGPCGG
jgi:hypothetical protein